MQGTPFRPNKGHLAMRLVTIKLSPNSGLLGEPPREEQLDHIQWGGAEVCSVPGTTVHFSSPRKSHLLRTRCSMPFRGLSAEDP